MVTPKSWQGVPVFLYETKGEIPDDFAYVYKTEHETTEEAAEAGIERYRNKHGRQPPMLVMSTMEWCTLRTESVAASWLLGMY